MATPIMSKSQGASVAGAPVVLVEKNVADYYDPPPEGEIRVAGGREVRTGDAPLMHLGGTSPLPSLLGPSSRS
jgi:hypothetical protein